MAARALPTSSAAPAGTPARALTPGTVVSTALDVADREGLDAVTLARVARELGCHVTSLYTHVDSIDDLHTRMLLTAQAALAQQLWEAALGRSGAEALRALATVYRGYGEAHPAQIRLLFAGATTKDPRVVEGAQYMAEPIRATLRGFGIDDEQVRHAHRAYSAAIRGFLVAEAQGAYPIDADVTFDQIVDLFVLALEGGNWPR
jgi:AcrR family transcriptional regulator